MNKLLIAAVISIIAASNIFAQTQVIAHRGFHATGNSYNNTISALTNAQQLGIYGSEFDVHETRDGSLIVIHGLRHLSISNVQDEDFATIRNLPLSNGEIVPTLDEYLEQGKQSATTRLIIEIKSHSTAEQETRVVKKVLATVEKHELSSLVEYIAFSKHVCNELVKYSPEGTKIAYLSGDLTPKQCKEAGFTGIDYSIEVTKNNPQWIKQSHELGLTVNVWTVNDTENLQWCIDHGVDFITTDNPTEAIRLLEK